MQAIESTPGPARAGVELEVEPVAALAAATCWRGRARSCRPAGRPRDGLALWALMSVDPDGRAEHVPEAVRRAAAGVGSGRAAIDDEVIEARYRWLDAEVGPLLHGAPDRSWTARVDRILIHPVFGFAIFLLLMFLRVPVPVRLGRPRHLAGRDAVRLAGSAVAARCCPPGVLTDLLVRAVIGGLGSVLVFLPQILLLFFFLGLLEDSGYMARVAYLMDRIMRAMDLHGRAFVPMLSGFACAIPAILATRTMERRRDRLLTMMVVPLMTCSARLPVYTLIIASLFPAAADLRLRSGAGRC